jgi:hypothetical protein
MPPQRQILIIEMGMFPIKKSDIWRLKPEGEQAL